MPIYEYQCRACGRTFEYQQRMSEDPKTVCESCGGAFELLVRASDKPVCPDCGSLRLAKQLSVPAAHTSGTSSLPVCEAPRTGGGCGAPWCGTGGCGM